jgi:hypothetical protein
MSAKDELIQVGIAMGFKTLEIWRLALEGQISLLEKFAALLPPTAPGRAPEKEDSHETPTPH